MKVSRTVLIFVLSCLWQFSYVENSTTLIHPKDVRIIGGHEVDKHSHPFQVALMITTNSLIQYLCGGTLLSNSWVLTSAHCVVGAAEVEARLAVHDISADESPQVWLTCTEFIVHESYNETTFLNDIALVKLPRNVTYNDLIQPIQYIEATNETFEGENGTVVGWGKIHQNSVLWSVLNYVNVSIISNEECASDETIGAYIADSHICSSGKGYVGACGGDSGGPLIHDGVQIGIVAFGSVNCSLGKPTAYTRLSEFSEWITDTVNGSSAAVSTYCIRFSLSVFILSFLIKAF